MMVKEKYSEEALKEATLQGVDVGRKYVFNPIFEYINERCDQVFLKHSKELDQLRKDLIDKLTSICLRAMPKEKPKFHTRTRNKKT